MSAVDEQRHGGRLWPLVLLWAVFVSYLFYRWLALKPFVRDTNGLARLRLDLRN